MFVNFKRYINDVFPLKYGSLFLSDEEMWFDIIRRNELIIKNRSECFNNLFPKQYEDILKYLIINNKLLFYFEIKFDPKIFDDQVVADNDNTGGVFECTQLYDYSLYPNQYEETRLRRLCYSEKGSIYRELVNYMRRNLKGLLAFTYFDLSFVNSVNEQDGFKRIRFVFGFETFTNEPQFFINILSNFTSKYDLSLTVKHIVSATELKTYWESRIGLSKFYPIQSAYIYFFAVGSSDYKSLYSFNPICLSNRARSLIESKQSVVTFLNKGFFTVWSNYDSWSEQANQAVVSMSAMLPIYDCFGNWSAKYSISKCPPLLECSDESGNGIDHLNMVREFGDYYLRSFAEFFKLKYGFFHFTNTSTLYRHEDELLEHIRCNNNTNTVEKVFFSTNDSRPYLNSLGYRILISLNRRDKFKEGDDFYYYLPNQLKFLKCTLEEVRGQLLENMVEFKYYEAFFDKLLRGLENIDCHAFNAFYQDTLDEVRLYNFYSLDPPGTV